jgi:hypothetical protein
LQKTFSFRPETTERDATDNWSQQSSEDLYNLNTLNGNASDPGFSPKPVRITFSFFKIRFAALLKQFEI